jgi:amino-acid N-acetyltransferase
MEQVITVSRATIGDAKAICDTVNLYAGRGDMLPRTMGEVFENLRDFYVARDSDRFLGCVALHFLWSDLAEVKSLAVAEDVQARGIGSKLVRACIDEAQQIGLERIFALSYKPNFFERLGFVQADVMTLPRKVWNECYRCPKFPSCNEIALVMAIDRLASSEAQDRAQPGLRP